MSREIEALALALFSEHRERTGHDLTRQPEKAVACDVCWRLKPLIQAVSRTDEGSVTT